MTAAEQPSGDARAWFDSEGRLLPADEIRSYLEWSGVDAAMIEAWVKEALEEAASGADTSHGSGAGTSERNPGLAAAASSSAPPEPRPDAGRRNEGPSRESRPVAAEQANPADDRKVGGALGAEIVPLPVARQTAPEPSHGSVPPQNLEAEESVLGAMLLSPGAVAAVSEVIQAADFYRDSHARIYRAALALYESGEPVDAITLTDALEASGELDNVGGRVRLHELAALVPATANAAHYARIVRETATLRGLIRAGGEISRLGWDRPGEAGELVDQAERIVFEVSQGRTGDDVTEQTASTVRDVFQRITDRYESGSEMVGLGSGLHDLDQLTAGFEPGNLIIVAARPSMGKSALLHTMLANVSIRQGIPSLLFTAEMSKNEVTQRLLAREGKVDGKRLRTGRLSPDDWPRLTAAANLVGKAPIFVNDLGDLGLSAIRSASRRLKQRHPTLGVVAVDFLQILSSEGQTRNEEVAKLSRGLKVLARELELPVIALSQLNRAVEQRNDKRPVLSDLRDSGAVEQDADLVMFLYRDEYYNEESEARGIAELDVAKHRNGPTGRIKVSFQKTWAGFSDLAAGSY